MWIFLKLMKKQSALCFLCWFYLALRCVKAAESRSSTGLLPGFTGNLNTLLRLLIGWEVEWAVAWGSVPFRTGSSWMLADVELSFCARCSLRAISSSYSSFERLHGLARKWCWWIFQNSGSDNGVAANPRFLYQYFIPDMFPISTAVLEHLYGGCLTYLRTSWRICISCCSSSLVTSVPSVRHSGRAPTAQRKTSIES